MDIILHLMEWSWNCKSLFEKNIVALEKSIINKVENKWQWIKYCAQQNKEDEK